ncbi:MAG: hypothetical protein E7314_04320 [Clostridiales bacterium]|nr:hypothetical protein [Clostridiales bacterium]
MKKLSESVGYWTKKLKHKERGAVLKFDRKNEEILGLISLSIDFPCRLMNRFECSGRSAYRAIEKMIDDGYIKRYRKDGISSLRIMKKGQDILIANNPDRFERAMEIRRYSRSDLVKRLRIHRVASTYATMRNSGVKIYMDEKPALFSQSEKELITLTDTAFYSALEIKELGPECTKIKFSRSVGVVLCTDEKGFIVYNTDNSLMKWSGKAEQRLYGVLTGILLNKGIQVNDFAGLMLGNDMNTALLQLNSKGGVKNSFFKLDNTFNEFYYVPTNKDGDLQLKLLINSEKRAYLRESVIQAFRLRDSLFPFAADGIDTEDRVTLLAYEFDMEKIRKFKSGLEMFEKTGIVICFDFQRKVLEEYFRGLARIVALNKDWVAKELNRWNEKE